MRTLAARAAALLLFLASHPASADPAPLAVAGRVEHPASLTLPQLQAMPPVTVTMPRATPQGPGSTSYTGALLWSLVVAATPVDEAGPHSHLRHTVMAGGSDGYVVALAIGELDPDFAGKQVIVAYEQDGKPLPAPRLVVPGDAKAGRNVRDLVSIDVR